MHFPSINVLGPDHGFVPNIKDDEILLLWNPEKAFTVYQTSAGGGASGKATSLEL